MLQLKEYQQRSLDTLRTYFQRCSASADPDASFYLTTKESEVFNRGIPYNPVQGMEGMPYVCIRIPTGGGKTLVACYAVETALEDLLEADRSVVLWLVPSNAILEQTLDALKNPQHPYRQALNAEVGQVRVMNVQEALNVNRATLDTETTIIVSTIQAFRVEDTDGRKVYEANGALMEHFNDLPGHVKDELEQREDGSVIPSLANVLRVRKPVVIVDEAHNARTELSFETLSRFDPSAIIEFTATPATGQNASNVLHSVSAAELKAEQMIKLPIRLTTIPNWKELLNSAIAERDDLERVAEAERDATGEYIRPIMLIQAEADYKNRDNVTVDVVEDTLKKDFRIPEDQIARATGADRELEDVDLLDPDCPIRYIITIQALREGWDCPFAYVLASVAELKSTQAVEQFVGRILRMPKAERKQHDPLNLAYTFAASENFSAALNAISDVLVENGFERVEAQTLVERAMKTRSEDEGAEKGYGPLFDGPSEDGEETVKVEIEVPEVPSSSQLDDLPSETRKKVSFDAEHGRLTFRGQMEESERDLLQGCFPSSEGKDRIEEAYRKVQTETGGTVKAPVEEGKPFKVPQLAVSTGELFEPFEKTHLLEHPWSLAEREATLPNYSLRPMQAMGGEIDIDSGEGKVQTRFIESVQRQLKMFSGDKGWTIPALVAWLDRTIPHWDIQPNESTVFLRNLIRHLIDERDFTIDQLARDKYRLKRAVEQRINEYRQRAHREAHQSFLRLDDGSPLTVDPDVCFSFSDDYPCGRYYQGPYNFQKHYYKQVGAFANDAEERCGQFIDQQPEVAYWVRNLERRPNHAFWLQTSTDRFYPDFVCKLRDERYLAVEYKGADRWSNDDSKEKRELGGVWEELSDGRCLFTMPKGPDHETIRAKLGG